MSSPNGGWRWCVSNIAWDAARDEEAAKLLNDYGARGIEVAPAKIRARPLEATDDEVAAYRTYWNSRGFTIPAFQALLFGRPELTILGAEQARADTAEYLRGLAALAEKLGATELVFGSPKNRRRGGLPADEAFAIARTFFADLGAAAARHGVRFCIEPNPAAYECDFLETAREAASLVRAVDSPGFRLHMDMSSMILNGEDVPATIRDCFDVLSHFHISEPFLAPVGGHVTEHARALRTLAELDYTGWVSIEMRSGSGDDVAVLDRALARIAPLLHESAN